MSLWVLVVDGIGGRAGGCASAREGNFAPGTLRQQALNRKLLALFTEVVIPLVRREFQVE